MGLRWGGKPQLGDADLMAGAGGVVGRESAEPNAGNDRTNWSMLSMGLGQWKIRATGLDGLPDANILRDPASDVL
jgi:hypothetical protein